MVNHTNRVKNTEDGEMIRIKQDYEINWWDIAGKDLRGLTDIELDNLVEAIEKEREEREIEREQEDE